MKIPVTLVFSDTFENYLRTLIEEALEEKSGDSPRRGNGRSSHTSDEDDEDDLSVKEERTLAEIRSRLRENRLRITRGPTRGIRDLDVEQECFFSNLLGRTRTLIDRGLFITLSTGKSVPVHPRYGPILKHLCPVVE